MPLGIPARFNRYSWLCRSDQARVTCGRGEKGEKPERPQTGTSISTIWSQRKRSLPRSAAFRRPKRLCMASRSSCRANAGTLCLPDAVWPRLGAACVRTRRFGKRGLSLKRLRLFKNWQLVPLAPHRRLTYGPRMSLPRFRCPACRILPRWLGFASSPSLKRLQE